MQLFIHLLIYNLLLSIILYTSLAINPRMWMHRMPPEVVQKVKPRTHAEKRMLIFYAIPFMLVMLAYPLFFILQNNTGWLNNFLTLFAFFASFTLWDTLVLDLLIFCIVTPRFLIIPGSNQEDYKNMRYHLRSGAKGLLISITFSVVFATILNLFVGFQ